MLLSGAGALSKLDRLHNTAGSVFLSSAVNTYRKYTTLVFWIFMSLEKCKIFFKLR